MDVILCRNVLMYFSEETATTVVNSLANCLVPEGWLAVNPVEGSFVRSESLSQHRFPKALLYRKGEKKPEVDRRWTDAATSSEGAARVPPEIIPKRRRTTAAEKRPSAAHRTRGTDSPAAAQRFPLEKAKERFRQGRYSETIRELQGIIAGHPGHPEALTLLARCHANQGSLPEAVRCCDLALASNRLAAGVHFLRSTILQEQGAEAEAKESLKRALHLDPDFVMAHFTMFVLSRQRGIRTEAERHRKIVEKLLSRCGREDVLPESDGITAGRLTETMRSWPVL
jgi:chemotaxis protein methyltransferase CheR